MENCSYEKWADKFADGELNKHERKEFKKHLSSCDICGKRIFELKSVRNLLSSAKEDLSLPALRRKVIERIETAESASLKLKFQAVLLCGRAVPVLATIAILFIILSIWDIGRLDSRTDPAIAFLEDRDAELPEIDLDIL